jgi:hypothetical protein
VYRRDRVLPPLPECLAHVWVAFADLTSTRQVGFGMGPITYQEIGAYQANALNRLRAWDVRLIRRIDDAVMAVVAAKTGPEAARTIEPNVVPATNVKAVKAMMMDLVTRNNARFAKPAEGG